MSGQERKAVNTLEHGIVYGRSYRKLPEISKTNTTIMFLFILLADALIFLFRRDLTLWASYGAWYVARIVDVGVRISEVEFMWTHIYTIDTAAVYPGPVFTFVNFIVSVAALFAFSRTKWIITPVAYWLIYLFTVHLVSSLFFMFFPQYFPYSILDITGLYMEVEIVTWLLIPPIMIGSVFFYPVGIFGKFALTFATLLYSFVFGTVRLALFLYVLHYGSVLFTAVLFFVFGSLIDFIYIVGFYSVYISRTAYVLAERSDVWKWLS